MSLPTFTAKSTAEDVAATFGEQIRGKTVLVTGTSINGIGFETARVLAKYAGLVIITGYNTDRLNLSAEAIKKETPSANIRQLVLDLSSLTAVRKAAAEVNAYPEPLHVIIHNAAASGSATLNPTVDGLEPRMATALTGPFLLTKLLAPKLLASSLSSSSKSDEFTPRVVVVSSAAHAFGPHGVDLGNIAHPDAAKYHNGDAYFQAKAAGILFASELARRAKGRIHAYSLHPGGILTNINQKGQDKLDLISMGLLTPEGLPDESKGAWKTMGEGAATTIVAAFDSRLDDESGAYLDDCVVANEKVAPHSSNAETASKLWEITEEIVGEKFTF
ncbi:short-chain dehydrogenase/reductase family protein [Favolaschia claudopus]|uniref:Short-chain dehydrogenase/reductase family protein n=1 Tax=Favolaschia claudopus TaxID=2862362 RepID=A0AAW0EFT8_9AGAR